ASNNPSTCNGSEGSFAFSGLLPNTTYQVTYTDDGVVTGPVTITSTAAGQLTITGLNAGIYTNFIFDFNGSITSLLDGQQLTNPVNYPRFSSLASFCAGSKPPDLPAKSINGINGTWSPEVVNIQTSGTYTFTPAAGTCGILATLTTVVIPKVIAAFPFGTSLTICHNGSVPVLSDTSTNGITGFWTPAVVDSTHSGAYAFTPTSAGCVGGTTFTVTVNPNIEPIFPFGKSTTICEGANVVTLPGKSTNNNITGTWSPATVSKTASNTYTFTPDSGQCATTTTYTVTVNPNIKPTFNAVAPICSGTTLTPLPQLSDNNITGTWSPALNDTVTTTYTFTPTAGQCADTAKLTITVNQKVTPTFAVAAPVCSGATMAALPSSSTNVIPVTGTWSPALNNTATTTYTFTPDPAQCAVATTFTWQVTPVPSLTSIIKDTTINDGTVLSPYNFAVNDPAGGTKWNNSNPSIGLPASGTGMVPSFKATNITDTPFTAIITTIPFINGCAGVSQSYKITVRPLLKDIFVPNIFSPNGDRNNDQLFIYGNHIASVDMQIFNQWGQRIITLTDTHQGWDGQYKGSGQPVGVYVYVLKAVMKDGRKVNMKGSITLIR
ncbi:MAG TPA: gliding motility-associated C-terminal domain-containing protein, partial [Niastella sp.]